MSSVSVGDEADRVRRPQPTNEEAQRVFDEFQPVSLGHGAGGVDDKCKRCVLTTVIRNVSRLDAFTCDPCVLGEWVLRAVPLNGERRFIWLRILLIEVVHEFLEAHEVKGVFIAHRECRKVEAERRR